MTPVGVVEISWTFDSLRWPNGNAGNMGKHIVMSHNSTVVGEVSHVQRSSFMICIHIKVDGHQSIMRIPNMVDDGRLP